MKTAISLLTVFCFALMARAQQDTSKSITLPVQMSVVPPLSTNGLHNASSTNYFSFNLLAGYSGGLEGLEIGGIANLIKNNVHGVQLSGFTNVVGGNTQGLQMSGFCNVNRGKTDGLQLSGFSNLTNDSSSGLQMAGFTNINREEFSGWQSAGFLNIVGKNLQGVQGAGFCNIVGGNVVGVQASGFTNQIKGNVEGIQAAGFINTAAGRVKGVQASGFINVARRLQGTQLGIINFADTLESGTPIGLLSIVRKGGFFGIEAHATEALPLGIQVKSGSKIFYNIFTVAAKTGPDFYWAWGTGVGSFLKQQGKFRIYLDLLALHVNDGQIHTDHVNLHGKAQLAFSWQPAKHLAISVGPSFNCLVVNKNGNEGIQNDRTLAPYTVSDRMYDQTRVQLWPGGFLSIRF